MPYTPKPKAYYIAKCRYYKGDNGNCQKAYSGTDAFFCGYEQWWVEAHNKEQIALLKELVEDYKADGHSQFQKDDGVPVSLKAVLWNCWAKWVSSPSDREGWREFYLREYLKQ